MATRFLIVDDDPALCEILQAVLSSAGLEAHTMTNSARAAELLAKEKFDGVFIDVNMPPPDGVELARQMRASGFNQKTPIIIITGEDDPGLQRRALEAGANLFLFKPISRPRVLRVLRVSHATIEQERRRYQRVSARCKVAIEFHQERLEGTTLDISLNGLLVATGRIFPAGTQVAVTVELAKGTPPIRAVGRVARVVGAECMGIELDHLGPTQSQQLQEFLLPRILAAMDVSPPDPFAH